LADRHDILRDLEAIYRHVSGRQRDVRMEDELERDLGLDSLMAAELLIELEQRYGCPLIDVASVQRARTVEEIVTAVTVADKERLRSGG
jgi:acyl carrier protein